MLQKRSKMAAVFSRVDRLESMMGHLEEIARGSGRLSRNSVSSETATESEGGRESSTNSSPWSLESHCRPLEEVVAETRLKGHLLDRIHRLEDHVLQLGLLLEHEIEAERKKEEGASPKGEKKTHRKGLKSLVKACMKTKTSDHEHPAAA